MNNYQWLLQMDGAERKAWFDAEHAEHQERALDGDTEPENEDSRDKLEADIRQYANPEGNTGTLGACWERKMLEFLDRQAAITEEKTRYKWVTASAEEIAAWRSKAEKLKEQVYELTAERERYREKFGKCIDYADAIHALMDEGIA